MGAYQIGELLGALIGMAFIGAGFAWLIRKVVPGIDFRISVGLAMAILAAIAGFTNSTASRPYPATFALYLIAGMAAYFVLVMTYARSQPRAPLSDGMEFGFTSVGIVPSGPTSDLPKFATPAKGEVAREIWTAG